MGLGIYILLGFSIGFVVIGIYFSNHPDMMAKFGLLQLFQGGSGGTSKTAASSTGTELNPQDLKRMQESAEDFLEFDKIYDGMISFAKDPRYFTMGFGVNGVNINMFNAEEKVALKNGFMSILNTLKDDTQFLVQSRYIDLSKNFEYYKPIIENNEKEKDRLIDRSKLEKSEVLKQKMIKNAEDLKQRNEYAKHIIDFFDFYVKQSECIYIKIFVFVNYRYESKTGFTLNKKKIINESFETLSTKVKILKEQFESIGLKTYSLDSKSTANVLYNSMLKNESSYQRLEDAIKNGLLDLAVINKPKEESEENSEYDDGYDDRYNDDYEYEWKDEAAVSGESEQNFHNEQNELDKTRQMKEIPDIKATKQNMDQHLEFSLDDDDDE
jgi:hypothetical protein